MWENLLVTGLRILWRDRLYAAINVIGLTVALATATLIALWIRYELTWESYLADPAHVHVVIGEVRMPQTRGNSSRTGPANLGPLLGALVEDGTTVARYVPLTRVAGVGATRSNERVAYVDARFFDVITFPFIAGERSLDRPGDAVLTEATARRLFGTIDALDRSFELDNRDTLRVSGVVKNAPSNSNFHAGIFVSSRAATSPLPAAETREETSEFTTWTLVRTKPGSNGAALTRALEQVAREKYGAEDDATGSKHGFKIWPARDAGGDGTGEPHGTSRSTLTLIGSVGLLILLLATVNFISLATARSTRRIREAGLRRTAGAGRFRLALLFMAEPLLLAATACLFAFVVVETSLTTVSSFIRADLNSPYLHGPGLVATVVALALLVGLLAGAYPAFALAGLRPAPALRGEGLADGHRLRQVLVVLQFSIAMALAISTIFMQRQAQFARELNLSQVEGDPLVVLTFPDKLSTSQRDVLLARLAASRKLRGAAGTSLVQGDAKNSIYSGDEIVPDRKITYSQVAIDGSFFAVQGQALLAGRTLDPARDGRGHVQRAVFNESAMRHFGFSSPAAMIGRTFGGEPALEAIGVVPDLPLQSAREETGPTVFTYEPESFRYALVRLPGAELRDGVAEIDRIWSDLLPLQPVQREFADERLARLWRTMQIQAGVMTFFCSLAIAIGLLGLLGLAAFNAEHRTKEIGVRKALGATTFDIALLLTRQTLAPVAIANLIGWPLALWATMRFLDGFALHIEIGVGPFALAGTGTLLFTGGVVLAYAIARSRLQPAQALRYE